MIWTIRPFLAVLTAGIAAPACVAACTAAETACIAGCVAAFTIGSGPI